jgi:hypothetical protein
MLLRDHPDSSFVHTENRPHREVSDCSRSRRNLDDFIQNIIGAGLNRLSQKYGFVILPALQMLEGSVTKDIRVGWS